MTPSKNNGTQIFWTSDAKTGRNVQGPVNDCFTLERRKLNLCFTEPSFCLTYKELQNADISKMHTAMYVCHDWILPFSLVSSLHLNVPTLQIPKNDFRRKHFLRHTPSIMDNS
jgi:hypothetical protein